MCRAGVTARPVEAIAVGADRLAALSCGMDVPDDATAFAIARELIERHGDNVAAFLETKISALMESGAYDEFNAWAIVRNAVALTLKNGNTCH
ncbi:hypothetical protein [Sphingomonas sp. DT-204]|uniref:hypothetical protein n=1 Tax=Sphingomonas sp. DT-204 TaxID=3396166 RepID=UPI003F1DA087